MNDIIIQPALQGIIVGNQLCGLGFFIFNLVTGKGIVFASAVYGLLTLIVIYPVLLIFLIIKLIQNRNTR